MTLSDLNDLDFSNVGAWPSVVKMIAVIVVMAAVGFAGYWFDTQELLVQLDGEKRKEMQLRHDFEEKQKVVANVEAYRDRLEKLKDLLATVLEQLPTRTEMPDLLESISDIGKINGLNFQLFKPEPERPREEFLAAVPISIRATASYHQFGAFVSSISALDRIVTLENARLSEPGGDKSANGKGDLVVQATLQTYRYLEDAE